MNQTARPGSQAKPDQPTLIADRVNTKIESSGKPLPNANMATAHAEIGVIQQAYDAGKTQGAAMTLKLRGKLCVAIAEEILQRPRRRPA